MQDSEQLDTYNIGIEIELHIIENITIYSQKNRNSGMLEILVNDYSKQDGSVYIPPYSYVK